MQRVWLAGRRSDLGSALYALYFLALWISLLDRRIDREEGKLEPLFDQLSGRQKTLSLPSRLSTRCRAEVSIGPKRACSCSSTVSDTRNYQLDSLSWTDGPTGFVPSA
jgi:hypothetical protein